jgi:hypothetical protein
MYSADSQPTYLSDPESRQKLKPSKRRNLTSSPVRFSVEPVMTHREEPVWETMLQADDGLHAQVVRVGANRNVQAPDPKMAGGYYVFVGNGSLVHGGEELGPWSMVVVENVEDSFDIRAGSKGVEALVLQFPREERA